MAKDYDDEDERPRRRRDEDDEPRASRDDDERPRRRRDEDEDDRPRRRRDSERDDYDDGPRRSNQKPHRGSTVLILGIFGLLCCGICGIIAFILGLIDLGEMKKGKMDESGRGMTVAGTVIGIVGFFVQSIGGVYFRMNRRRF